MASPHNPTTAMRKPFPHSEDEFKDDSRIRWSEETNNFALQDENDEQWEWNAKTSRWTVISYTDAEIAEHIEATYSTRRSDDPEAAEGVSSKRKPEAQPQPPAKMAKKQHQNSAIFITNLPDYTTIDGLEAEFKKYGLIAESIDDDSKRIKMYFDDDGNFKGEALIVYHRPESIGNATLIADGAQYDPERPSPAGPMRVTEAAEVFKTHVGNNATGENGNAQPGQTGGTRVAKRPLSEHKKKVLLKKQKQDSELADWSDDDVHGPTKPNAPKAEAKQPVQQTVIILKHVFTLKALKEETGFRKELEEDMRDEAEKHGKVLSVAVWDGEEDGIVTIGFDSRNAAESCIKKFHGRRYDGRTLDASLAERRVRYKMMADDERLAIFQKQLDEQSD